MYQLPLLVDHEDDAIRFTRSVVPALKLANRGASGEKDALGAGRRVNHPRDRLGWTNPPGKSYLFPTKIICQEPEENKMLFWREVGANEVPPSLRPKEKLNPAVIAGELAEALQKSARRLTAGELRELARCQFGRKKGDDAYEYLVKNTQEFNVTELKTPNSNVRFYEVGVLPL